MKEETEVIQESVEAGRRHFSSRNYRRAEQEFLKVLKSGRRYADILNMLGVIYHSEGKFNDAIERFEEALQINPNYTEANLNLAILFNDLGEYDKSKALYTRVRSSKKRAATMNPVMRAKIANMHAQVGDTYSGIGLHTDAIEEYKKALNLCPTFKDIKMKLGISYRENNQKELSIKELAETVRMHPQFTPARIQLGLSHFTKGDTTRAAREWQAVLKKDKTNRLAQMYLKVCGANGKR